MRLTGWSVVRRGSTSPAACFFSCRAAARRATCDAGWLNSPAALAKLALHGTGEFGEEDLTGLQVGDGLNLGDGQHAAVHVAALDDKRLVVLAKVLIALACDHRLALDEGDGGRTGEQLVEAFHARLFRGELGQGVLGDGVGCALTEGNDAARRSAERKATVFRDDRCRGSPLNCSAISATAATLSDLAILLASSHFTLSSEAPAFGAALTKTPRAGSTRAHIVDDYRRTVVPGSSCGAVGVCDAEPSTVVVRLPVTNGLWLNLVVSACPRQAPRLPAMAQRSKSGDSDPDWSSTRSMQTETAARADAAAHAVLGRHLHRLARIPGTAIAAVAVAEARAGRRPTGRLAALFPSWHYWWQAHLLDLLVDAPRPRGPAASGATSSRNCSAASTCAIWAAGPTTTTTTWRGSVWPSSGHAAISASGAPAPNGCWPTGSCGRGHHPRAGIPWRTMDYFFNTPANGPGAIPMARTGHTDRAVAMCDWMHEKPSPRHRTDL